MSETKEDIVEMPEVQEPEHPESTPQREKIYIIGVLVAVLGFFIFNHLYVDRQQAATNLEDPIFAITEYEQSLHMEGEGDEKIYILEYNGVIENLTAEDQKTERVTPIINEGLRKRVLSGDETKMVPNTTLMPYDYIRVYGEIEISGAYMSTEELIDYGMIITGWRINSGTVVELDPVLAGYEDGNADREKILQEITQLD